MTKMKDFASALRISNHLLSRINRTKLIGDKERYIAQVFHCQGTLYFLMGDLNNSLRCFKNGITKIKF